MDLNKNITCYPFLQSANLDYEYRPVTKAAGLPVVSTDAGPRDTPRDTLLRCSYISPDGSSYTLFYRNVPADRKDGSPYLDQFGRHITRSEGVVVKGDWSTIPITQKHMQEVHDLLTPYFEEFWTHTQEQYKLTPPLLEVKETVSITPEDAKAQDRITRFLEMPRSDARPKPEETQPDVSYSAPTGTPAAAKRDSTATPSLAKSPNVAAQMGWAAAVTGLAAAGVALTGKDKHEEGKEPEEGRKKWTFARIASTGLLLATTAVLAVGAMRGSGSSWSERMTTGFGGATSRGM